MTLIELDPLDNPATERPSDVAELAVGAARSDARAWEALVNRYGRMVHSIARAHGLGEADAADVSQTVWLRLVEHLGRIRQPERVGGWLATTARNESIRVARQRQRTLLMDDLDLLGLVDDASDAVPALEAEERATHLRAALATLPSPQRDLLHQLMADPRPSYVEVSTRLGIPIGSIGPTRQRSLHALRSKCQSARI